MFKLPEPGKVRSRSRRLKWRTAAAMASLALVLAACGSSAKPASSPTTAVPGPSSSSTSSSGTGGAAQTVSTYEATHSWTPPGSVSNVAAAKGKLVYWIQLTTGVPTYPIRQVGLQAALGILGMKLQICNANLTPSGAAACASQALNAGAAGIILDSIDPAWITAQMPKIQSSGTALEVVEDGFPQPTFAKEGFVASNLPLQEAIVAAWAIVDSAGKAHVLIVGAPGVLEGDYVAGAQKEFQQNCPGCHVTVIKPDPAQLPQLPATVSAAITSQPSTEYVLSFSETETPLVQRGIGLSGKGSSIKLVSGGGVTLSGLQSIQAGTTAAESGDGGYLFGWVEADEVLRLILGQPAPANYGPPNRLFDKSNLGSIQLSSAAQATGQWWGVSDVESIFKTTWGLG